MQSFVEKVFEAKKTEITLNTTIIAPSPLPLPFIIPQSKYLKLPSNFSNPSNSGVVNYLQFKNNSKQSLQTPSLFLPLSMSNHL
jgi:hypothetical protein